jgi:hypothetical protein
MAVKGILVGKEMGESENFLHQSFGSAQLYEFKAPPPYARAPAQVKYIPEDQMLAALKSPDFNPNREAYLSESWKPLEFSPSKSITIGPNNNFSYSIAKDDMDGQTFKVHMDEGGLAVFSEIMFSGWKARLDGQPTPLLTADHAFRAVEVPAGEHSVEFHYEPAWAKPLLVGLLLWLLSALGYGLFILWRGPRASLPSPARA